MNEHVICEKSDAIYAIFFIESRLFIWKFQ